MKITIVIEDVFEDHYTVNVDCNPPVTDTTKPTTAMKAALSMLKLVMGDEFERVEAWMEKEKK